MTLPSLYEYKCLVNEFGTTGMTDSTNYFSTPSKTNQQPPLTHQDLLATLDTANASMSKLEQARQRALQRSQNTTIGTSGTPSKAANANVFVDESPPPPPPPMDSPPKQSRRVSTRSGPSNSSSVKDRMSKLDLMTKVRMLRSACWRLCVKFYSLACQLMLPRNLEKALSAKACKAVAVLPP